MAKARSAPDVWMIVSILLILAIGLVMVYSASAVLAFHDFGDKFYYVKRQVLFAALGIAAMFVTMNADYWIWKKWAQSRPARLLRPAYHRAYSRNRCCARGCPQLAWHQLLRYPAFRIYEAGDGHVSGQDAG